MEQVISALNGKCVNAFTTLHRIHSIVHTDLLGPSSVNEIFAFLFAEKKHTHIPSATFDADI